MLPTIIAFFLVAIIPNTFLAILAYQQQRTMLFIYAILLIISFTFIMVREIVVNKVMSQGMFSEEKRPQ